MTMNKAMYFFLIFLAALIGTRIFIYFYQQPSPTIWGIRLHHYMYGLVIMGAAYFLKNIPLYSFGLALFVDQVPYLIVEREPFGDERFNGDIYWDKMHLMLLLALVILIFLFKDYLLPFKGES